MNLQLTLCNIEQIMVLKLDNLKIGRHISEAAFVYHLNQEYNECVKKMFLEDWENRMDMFCEIAIARPLDTYPKWNILNLPDQTQSSSILKLLEAIIRGSVGAARMISIRSNANASKSLPVLFRRPRSLSDPNLESFNSLNEVSQESENYRKQSLSDSMNSIRSNESFDEKSDKFDFKL